MLILLMSLSWTNFSFNRYIYTPSLVLVEPFSGFHTNNAWTPPMAVHSRHVAKQPLWWWGGWAHWIVFMASLYMYNALCFVYIEHSVCHEPISVSINIYTPLAQCLLSTLLVLTLTMLELPHWPSIASMLPQRHCGDEEDGRIGLSSWRHYTYIVTS